MGKHFKKAAALLAACLSASMLLAACSSGGGTTSSAGGSSTGGGTGSTTSTPAASGEKISLKVTTVNFGESPEGTKIQDAWMAMMKDKLGRDVEINYEFINSGDYKEKLQVINAGGDLPDVLTYFGVPKADVDKYGAMGLYINVADYLDKAPNYKAALEKDPNAKTSIYTPSGELYGFFNLSYVPSGSAHGAASTMMAVKNRVLKENNLSIPTTLDEMYEVAKALKEAGVSNYPIIQHEEWQNPEDVVFRAYHTSANNSLGKFWNGEAYAYGPITEDYKLALQYLNKLYTEGLISPDYFTHTVDNGNAAIADGSACIIPSSWEGYPAQWSVQYPEDEWVAVPNPTSDKYADSPWQFENEFHSEWEFNPGYSMIVSAQSKCIDDAVALLDLQYDPDVIELLNWGIEGETFQITDGKKEFLLGGTENRDAAKGYGLPLSGDCRAGIFPQPQDMELWRIGSASDSPIFYNGELLNEKLVGFSSRVISPENTVPSDSAPKISLTSEENEEYSNIMTPVETYAKEQKVKFIKGERSFDEWDQYIEEINKMGDIQAALKILNDKVPA